MTYLVVFKIYRMRNDEELINLLYTQNMIQNIQKYMSIIRHLGYRWVTGDSESDFARGTQSAVRSARVA